MGQANIGSGNSFDMHSLNTPVTDQHRQIIGKGAIMEGSVGNGQPHFISAPTGKGADLTTKFGIGLGYNN